MTNQKKKIELLATTKMTVGCSLIHCMRGNKGLVEVGLYNVNSLDNEREKN